MRVRCQQSKAVYDLADRRGSGAGGTVYAVANGTRAVKVVKRPEPAKLRALCHFRRQLDPFGVVCPEDLVVDDLTGEVVGYVMRLAPGQTVEQGPTDVTPSLRQRILAALALAKAVQAVHGLKPRVVLRDLKDANVLVDFSADPPTVAVIDFDSACVFQARGENGVDRVDYLAAFHTPGFNPSEHIDTPGLIPTHSTDLFALGVVLFTLVFGRSPYDVIGRAVGDLNRAVTEKRFPRYVTCGRAPTYAVADVPHAIDELFRVCFTGSSVDRPTATRWGSELEAWLAIDPTPQIPPADVTSVPSPRRSCIGRLKVVARWTVAAAMTLSTSGGGAGYLLTADQSKQQPTPPLTPPQRPAVTTERPFFAPSIQWVFDGQTTKKQ